jgi:uracil phosphoribosyltransferase
VLHKLAILRDEKTEPKKFREVVRELSWLLGYEALADARLRPLRVRTPLEEIDAHELGDRIGLVPILRAGLGMVDAMLELMPTAQVWHLGLFRDERRCARWSTGKTTARRRSTQPRSWTRYGDGRPATAAIDAPR